jgi:hypothetical protein
MRSPVFNGAWIDDIQVAPTWEDVTPADARAYIKEFSLSVELVIDPRAGGETLLAGAGAP